MKDKIEQILIDMDIMGLIRIGAPLDEYRYEAKLIAERIKLNLPYMNQDMMVEEIQGIVYHIFTEQFCSYVFVGMKNDETNDETNEQIEKMIGKFEDYLDISREIKALLDE
jgi:hypothetical protein